MMQHIHDKACIKMMMWDKANFKKDGYNNPWYTTTDINIYCKYLDDLTKNIDARDISTSKNEKVSVAVAQIWESKYFTEESMIKLEKKAAGKKISANVKIYFGELYQDCMQFSRSTASKWAKFDRAKNIKEESARK